MDRDRPIVRIQASETGKRIAGSRLGIRRPKLTPETQTRRLGPTLERRLNDANDWREENVLRATHWLKSFVPKWNSSQSSLAVDERQT